jgi:transposase InsO family protein
VHLCKLLGISRQAYYKRIQTRKKRSAEMEIVKAMVVKKRILQPRIGTRKLYYLLSDQINVLGIKMGRDALFDLLKAEHMLVKPMKCYTKTTNSKHWLHKHPNYFKDMRITYAEQAWVSDITYLRTRSGFCYLSLVTDSFSRKIMGYHVSPNLQAEGCIKSLKLAIKHKIHDSSPLHHSDKGFQYCSEEYQTVLNENFMKCSMTDGYDPYQNALAERMNGILKNEFFPDIFENIDHACKIVEQSVFIYNNLRPHLNLNMETPNSVQKKSRKQLLSALNLFV